MRMSQEPSIDRHSVNTWSSEFSPQWTIHQWVTVAPCAHVAVAITQLFHRSTDIRTMNDCGSAQEKSGNESVSAPSACGRRTPSNYIGQVEVVAVRHTKSLCTLISPKYLCFPENRIFDKLRSDSDVVCMICEHAARARRTRSAGLASLSVNTYILNRLPVMLYLQCFIRLLLSYTN